MLDFLEEHPGDTWQQRWKASGADTAGDDWAQGPAQWLEPVGLFSASRLEAMTATLPALIGADLIRPSLRWLLTGGKKRKMTTNLIRSRIRRASPRSNRSANAIPNWAHRQSQPLYSAPR